MTDQPSTDSGSIRLDDLTYDECLARLASQQIGRLAVVVDNYPQVFCVNYRLDGFTVVFRTHVGTKLLAAHHANVGFEVDSLDQVGHTGWTVLVQGMAEDVTDRLNDTVTERSRDLGVEPWVPGDQPRIVRIIPAKITGRQLSSGELLWATDDHGYL